MRWPTNMKTEFHQIDKNQIDILGLELRELSKRAQPLINKKVNYNIIEKILNLTGEVRDLERLIFKELKKQKESDKQWMQEAKKGLQ